MASRYGNVFHIYFLCCLGGVVVSVFATGPKGSNPAEAMDLLGDKNQQHTFLRMGSKDGGPTS
jgi:hypothetical protein